MAKSVLLQEGMKSSLLIQPISVISPSEQRERPLLLEYDADKKKRPILSQGGAAAIIEETISDDEVLNPGDLMKPD